MENNTEKQEFEFSLVSFFKIFKGKFKMLVAIGLISAILGGVVGALIATTGNRIYGNTLSFHLPTEEKSEYSAVIPLLESDLFAEDILIGTKTVEIITSDTESIKVKIPDLPFSKDDQEALSKLEAEKLKSSEKITDYKAILKKLPLEITNLKSKLDAANSAYSPLKDEYNRLWTVYSEGLSLDAKEKLSVLENSAEYKNAKSNFTAAQSAYDNKIIEQTDLEASLFAEEKAFNIATTAAEAIISPLREQWAQNKNNKKSISNFQKNVTFSFSMDEEVKPEEISTDFLYVNITVPKDIKEAENLISAISENLPQFIVKNTAPAEKYDEIKCVRISSSEVKDLNDTSLIKNTATYAIIFFIVFEALTCIVIIGAYLKKNWLPTVMADESIENTENSEENKD